MVRIGFLLLVLFQAFVVKSQDLHLQWAERVGASSQDNAYAVAEDAWGNVYITGIFGLYSVDFDPGIGTYNLPNNGLRDVYVLKLTSEGEFLWARAFGGTQNEYGHDLVVMEDGDVVVCGVYSGTVDFDPGSGTAYHTSQAGNSSFVVSLDSAGDFNWVRSFSGGPNLPNSIAINSDNELFIAGGYDDSLVVSTSSGSSTIYAQNAFDGYIVRLDDQGNNQMLINLQGQGNQVPEDVAIDANGNIYCTGAFSDLTDFNPGSGTYLVDNIGPYDGFIWKLDAQANFQWASVMAGASANVRGYAIGFDATNAVYLAGAYTDSVDFDPGSGVFALETSSINLASFIEKFRPDGSFIWAISTGGNNGDYARNMVTTLSGDCYAMGVFSGSADFDPGSGTFNLTSSSASHYLWKVDSAGTLDFAVNLVANTGPQFGVERLGLYIDTANHELYMAGVFAGTQDLDPLPTSTSFLSSSSNSPDAYMLQLYECPVLSSEMSETACGSYFWDLTGLTYTFSGDFTSTQVSERGCDSLVTLHLTILPEPHTYTSVMACEAYFWSASGQTYTESGEYNVTVAATSGCDSVSTLTLQIDTVTTSVSVSTTMVGNDLQYTFTADQDGASYQWVDCYENYAPVTGETAQSFTPLNDGSYAVIIQKGACVDTSDCFLRITPGVEDVVEAISVSMFPNPSSGTVTVLAERPGIAMRIYNLNGDLISEHTLGMGSNMVRLPAPAQVYMVEWVCGAAVKHERIVRLKE